MAETTKDQEKVTNAFSVQKSNAQTYLIRHKDKSFALFFINKDGDLFISSDWGHFTFSWRAWGSGTFKEFLLGLDEEYFFGKLEINHNNWGGKKLGKNTEDAVKVLFKSFQAVLRDELKQKPAMFDGDLIRAAFHAFIGKNGNEAQTNKFVEYLLNLSEGDRPEDHVK
jgi:hypothetical protein